MLNEGLVTSDVNTHIKSAMVNQLNKLGRTTPNEWERKVFHAVTNMDRDDVDWSLEDNQAGYYTWIKAFDRLIGELVEDGYVKVEEDNGVPYMIRTESSENGSWPSLDVTSFAPGV